MIKNFVINNSQGMHREIVLHAHKVMKKIQLTHYLFNQLRSSDGLQIISEENLFSASGHFGEDQIIFLDEQSLACKPLALRVLYNTLFSKQSNKQNALSTKKVDWNQLSSVIFQRKDSLNFDYAEIQTICAHHIFPVILAAKKSSILVIWNKTMTAVGELQGGRYTYNGITLNNNGDKVVGIDSVGD